jgi:undecaprenyl-diphosphatase
VGAAWLLGIVQGLTEFLPVSSSGHLVVLRDVLGVRQGGAAWEVALHLGTLAALVIGLAPRLEAWMRRWRRGDPVARRLVLMILWGTVPAALTGLLAGQALVPLLFRPKTAACGFVATSVALWTTPPPGRGQRTLDDLRLGDALVVGLAQAVAIVPGLSRSGATMAAARWCGLAPDAAAELSFLLAIPVTMGAVVLQRSAIAALGMAAGVGAVAALAAGLLALRAAFTALAAPRWWRPLGLYTMMMAIWAAVLG